MPSSSAACRLWRSTAEHTIAALMNCGRTPTMERSFVIAQSLLILQQLFSRHIAPYLGGRTQNDLARRDVPGNDGASGNQRVFSQRKPGKHRDIGSNARAPLHGDAFVKF